MAASRTVTVTIEYVANDVGLWCNTCMLSTGARIWWTCRIGGGETTLNADLFCTEGGKTHDVSGE